MIYDFPRLQDTSECKDLAYFYKKNLEYNSELKKIKNGTSKLDIKELIYRVLDTIDSFNIYWGNDDDDKNYDYSTIRSSYMILISNMIDLIDQIHLGVLLRDEIQMLRNAFTVESQEKKKLI